MSRRQDGIHHFQHGIHLGFGFADRETADGIAREIQPHQEFGRLLAQVGEDAALHDAEQRLVGACFGAQAAFCPGMGALHGSLAVIPVVRRSAFVKSHDDIGAQVFLDVRSTFRA